MAKTIFNKVFLNKSDENFDDPLIFINLDKKNQRVFLAN